MKHSLKHITRRLTNWNESRNISLTLYNLDVPNQLNKSNWMTIWRVQCCCWFRMNNYWIYATRNPQMHLINWYRIGSVHWNRYWMIRHQYCKTWLLKLGILWLVPIVNLELSVGTIQWGTYPIVPDRCSTPHSLVNYLNPC